MNTPYQHEVFTAPKQRVCYFCAVVSKIITGGRPLRILDIGCGTGGTLLSLLALFPSASGVGVDISEPNITAARMAARDGAAAGRAQFERDDYWQKDLGTFDLILSDSVFHLVPLPGGQIFAKVTADLRAGGLLVMTIPYDCLCNRLLWAVRRLLLALRSPFTDWLILLVGRIVHGRAYPEEMLRERVFYMYHAPATFYGKGLHALLTEEMGLDLVFHETLPHASLAQAKHTLLGLRKPAQ